MMYFSLKFFFTGDNEEDQQPKKVDKLGRVRPKRYRYSENPSKTSRKKPQTVDPQIPEVNYPEHDDVQDTVFDSNEINEPHTLPSIPSANESDVDIDKEHEFKTVHQIIEEAIFVSDNENDNVDDQNDSNLFSDEKWDNLNDLWSDEEDADDEEKEQDNLFSECDKTSKIYHGHTMTVYTSMVLILLYSVCHNISGAQLNDLLTLISLHCLHPHPGLQSIYVFKQFFTNLHSPIVKHYYCFSCYRSINEDTEECPNEKCKKRSV